MSIYTLIDGTSYIVGRVEETRAVKSPDFLDSYLVFLQSTISGFKVIHISTGNQRRRAWNSF